MYNNKNRQNWQRPYRNNSQQIEESYTKEINEIIDYIKTGNKDPFEIFGDDGKIKKLVSGLDVKQNQIRKIYSELLKEYEEILNTINSSTSENNTTMNKINTEFSILVYRIYYQTKRIKEVKPLFKIVSESIKDFINEKDMEKWKNKIERLKLTFEAIIAYSKKGSGSND